MPRSSKYAAFVFTLALLAIAGLAMAFPFWLSSPARSNPNDPMSPVHPVGSPTATVDTYTYTAVSTATSMATATSAITATPTMTPTFGPGPLLADFENSPTSADDNWVEPILVGADTTDGSTLAPAAWAAGSQTTGNGPSDAGSYCGCISGSLVQQQGSVYPYAYMAMEVTPSGQLGGAGDNNTYTLGQWTGWDPNNGIQFDYKATAGVPNTSYVVQMITDNVVDGQYYQYQFTPADTNWHTLDVYFPGVNTIGALFTQPNYGGGTQSLVLTDLGAVQIKVVASTTGGESYGICVDNVGFNPPVAPTPTAAVFNGEQTTTDATDLWGQSIVVTCTASSIISPSPNFVGFTGSDPNFAPSTYYARISGTVGTQTGTGSDPYPYAYMAFNLAANGTAGSPGGSFVNCLPQSPNYGFQFDYKAGASCTEYTVELISDQITNTAYWNYTWTSPDTNWHTVDVYFPASATWLTPQAGWTPPASGNNILTEPNYGAGGAAFDPENVGSFLFKPVASLTAPVDYDLSIDNLTFAPPPATGGPALDESGGTITNANATVISTFEYAGTLAQNECGGGAGPLSSGAVFYGFGGTGTTMNPATWADNGGVADNGPTLSGSTCMELSGTLAPGGYVVSIFDFNGGSGPCGQPFGGACTTGPYAAYAGNIESLAPNKRFVFDYRNGSAAQEGQEMNVQLATQNAEAYDFYYYTFDTAADTAWHTIVIYFPDSPYGPVFQPFPGECVSWDPNAAELIEIGPVGEASNVNYDLFLDNLWFD